MQQDCRNNPCHARQNNPCHARRAAVAFPRFAALPTSMWVGFEPTVPQEVQRISSPSAIIPPYPAWYREVLFFKDLT